MLVTPQWGQKAEGLCVRFRGTINSLHNPASSSPQFPRLQHDDGLVSSEHQASLDFQVEGFEKQKALCKVPSLHSTRWFYQDGEESGGSCLRRAYCVPSTVLCS